MVTALASYLSSLRDNLRLDPPAEREVIRELQAHIEDRVQELQQAGLSREEATRACLRLLGSAKLVAHQMYEAHSQGSWRHALLSSLPHLFFALLFTLNWWQWLGWQLALSGLVLGGVVYGWWHSKPAWFFPWLGYMLLPLAAGGIALLYLPVAWSWVAIVIYLTLAVWLLYRVTVQTIRRDWLYTSLMLLPVPVIIGWALAIESEVGFSEYSLTRIQHFSPWMGLTFLTLGLPVAAFVRFRKRWLKVGVLISSGLLTLAMVAYYSAGLLTIPAFILLMGVMFGLFLMPAILERRLRRTARRLYYSSHLSRGKD